MQLRKVFHTRHIRSIVLSAVALFCLLSGQRALAQATVFAWGYNGNGQLGNGTLISRNRAAAGTGWASGSNGSGEACTGAPHRPAGSGGYPSSNAPVAVSGRSGVVAIAGGYIHSLALKSDGTVWAWGSNDWWQLGYISPVNTNTPVEVPALSGVKAIAGGVTFSEALKSDGTVWAWGFNYNGELGNGTRTPSAAPV